jgi:serine/threonine protein phosphatase 1
MPRAVEYLFTELPVRRDLIIRMRHRPPRVADGIRVYAIGDIHGRADLLERTLSTIDSHRKSHPAIHTIEVFLGDYIDRGPASRQVIDLLIQRARSNEQICLRGNHENYAQQFLDDPSVLRDWRQYGGLETLVSYGLKPTLNPSSAEQVELSHRFANVLPADHHRFLKRLPLSFVSGDFFFVHAGVRPGVALERQQEHDLLCIRDDFLVCEDDFGKIIVHGHTPVLDPEVHSNRINIDTGAYATGKLTCLALEKDRCTIL